MGIPQPKQEIDDLGLGLESGNAVREFQFSETDFRSLVALARERTGISLSDSKRNLIYSRLSRRLRALGIARPRALEAWDERYDVRGTGEAARVDGVRGLWRVDPDRLADLDDFAGRTAILSPLDRLVFDRKRMEDLFAFDYQLEMYKPAASRQWGYWAMPVLDGDELVGKVDATADREAGVLIVDAVHEDGDWSTARRGRVHAELDALGEWLGLEVARS